MPPRFNPLKLNKLQLKTLVLLQELARSPRTSMPNNESGDVLITLLPQPHGNHFHIGSRVVMAKDASGLRNENVWRALERKGLARSHFPLGISLTPDGLCYETNLGDQILIGADH